LDIIKVKALSLLFTNEVPKKEFISTNRVMNFSGAPAHTWLLALMYVCLSLNHLASDALGWKPPEQILTGQQPDISKFMHFSSCELVLIYLVLY
jgi:hypothetical protein